MPKILLTCEHGGNNIPPAFKNYFKEHEAILSSHEGYDIGALDVFRTLQEIADVSFHSEDSRLLVELNRSRHHPKLFSAITQKLPDDEKNQLLKTIYYPYRDQVEQMVQDLVSAGRKVIHISVHTFTPVLKGKVRLTDIGLLYNPQRPMEQEICKNWKAALLQDNPEWTVRYNYPYLGIADGFPTYLRRRFTNDQYAGIELEVNNKFCRGNEDQFQKLKVQLKNSLAKAIAPILSNADRDFY
ncbi:N-formylglutamate amidohydrolase [Pontibacter qinzhouensis]|uniref:N-formylglutamate amidohydrolase n=1 Tax=Pontibacter qinzhouensis TaxID=2603253 RepID=A0A5C8JFR4_9BACT|nr:N-formylglutamate amidohydrolase [Pontibacter qinzhouensis]TXK36428.1 N-formylglutamate amidohydrolase [Pontibacter qinzhouensis]